MCLLIGKAPTYGERYRFTAIMHYERARMLITITCVRPANFASSLATMNASHYLLGIGDRSGFVLIPAV